MSLTCLVRSDNHPTAYPLDAPNDWGKIKWITELIAEGYVNQIMLAQEIQLLPAP